MAWLWPGCVSHLAVRAAVGLNLWTLSAAALLTVQRAKFSALAARRY